MQTDMPENIKPITKFSVLCACTLIRGFRVCWDAMCEIPPRMGRFEGQTLEDSARTGPWVRLKGFYQLAACAGIVLRRVVPQPAGLRPGAALDHEERVA